jgi:hypothetical protein
MSVLNVHRVRSETPNKPLHIPRCFDGGDGEQVQRANARFLQEAADSTALLNASVASDSTAHAQLLRSMRRPLELATPQSYQ